MAERIRVVVADDEPLVREGLRAFLAEEPGVELVAQARDGLETVRLVEELKPDVLFLDVQMPELDGFQVLDQIEPRGRPVVVFVTAFESYALRAFAAHAIDYLLKPFDHDRFALALGRARAWLSRPLQQDEAALAALLEHMRGERVGLERFIVRHAGRLRLLPAAEVEWIEARGNYVYLHHRDGAFMVRDTMSQLARELDAHDFVRIHRSTIVRLAAVRDLTRLPGGDWRVRLRDGGEVTLSRTYRAAFERALGRKL